MRPSGYIVIHDWPKSPDRWVYHGYYIQCSPDRCAKIDSYSKLKRNKIMIMIWIHEYDMNDTDMIMIWFDTWLWLWLWNDDSWYEYDMMTEINELDMWCKNTWMQLCIQVCMRMKSMVELLGLNKCYAV